MTTTDETPRDPIRDSPGYRRRLAHLELVREQRQADEHGRPDLLEQWIEFGKHNWLWQMFHSEPS